MGFMHDLDCLSVRFASKSIVGSALFNDIHGKSGTLQHQPQRLLSIVYRMMLRLKPDPFVAKEFGYVVPKIRDSHKQHAFRVHVSRKLTEEATRVWNMF